jgi:hypothetical protein
MANDIHLADITATSDTTNLRNPDHGNLPVRTPLGDIFPERSAQTADHPYK